MPSSCSHAFCSRPRLARPCALPGWCIFEEGVALTTLSELVRAAKLAERWQWELPVRFQKANLMRPKFVDLSVSCKRAYVDAVGAPEEVLEAVMRRVQVARFTGTDDRARVLSMLHAFDWSIHIALAKAQKLQNAPIMRVLKETFGHSDVNPVVCEASQCAAVQHVAEQSETAVCAAAPSRPQRDEQACNRDCVQ